MNAAPVKVLIVDDEPPMRKLMRMGLSTQGYEILEAPDGRTALKLLDQNPDLIILDLGLPDIEGHELLEMIRGRSERVPIVVVSSRGDESSKVLALDLGADDYITKPFGMDELLARMRTALRHQLQVHANALCSGQAISPSIWRAASSRSVAGKSNYRLRNMSCCGCSCSTPGKF